LAFGYRLSNRRTRGRNHQPPGTSAPEILQAFSGHTPPHFGKETLARMMGEVLIASH
jgi:hypothetical protein